MEKQTIVNLIKAVNSKLKNKTLSNMLVGKVNTYHQSNMSESDIYSNLLDDISGLNETLKNPELTAIVETYSSFKTTEKITLKNLVNESGLTKLVTNLKASNSFADPVIKQKIQKLEEQLGTFPEFRVIPSFIETLKPHAYDSSVKEAITEAKNYLDKNGAKVVILNAIFEFKNVPTDTYSKTVSILEQALLDDQISVDALKMKLHSSANMPAVKKMLNHLSLVEGKTNKSFNLGTGTYNTDITPLIAPSVITNESSIITVLNNRFVEIKKDSVSFIEPKQVFETQNAFYNYVINFSKLGFTSVNEGVRTKFRQTEIEFKNEGTSVVAYINKKKVDTSASINYADLFLMENMATKNMVAELFENIKYMTSLDFVKNIKTPNKSCNVVSIDKNLFVIENDNSGNVLNMNALQFVKFIKENYGHDTTELFTDELDSSSNEINGIEDEKRIVNDDILKLEQSLEDVDTSIADTNDEAIIESAMDLRFNIEKHLNSLREKYIVLESKKKAILEHNIISTTKRHNMGDSIKTKDGRHGKVRGVDTSTGRYMVAFEGGSILPVTESEIV